MEKYKYHLENYHPGSKKPCPQCGRKACFSAAEQVSEIQANLLGAAFELTTGGTAQLHVGTGGGGSTSELPWNDEDKNLKKRTAIKRH